MNKLLLIRRASRLIFSLLLVAFGLLAVVENAYAQNKPEIPWLSLTGEHDTYNSAWYPDGRIWVPPSTTSPREFLMPVFMDNKWATYPATADRYQATPIKSFEFKILYDSSSLRAIGVQTEHPFNREEATEANRNDARFKPWYEPLAKNFNFSVWDEKNTNYRKYLNPALKDTDIDPAKGRAFRIVATSSQPLPNTALDRREYKVLLYVVFRVIPNPNKPSTYLSQSAKNSPIIIDDKVIKYNDLNIRVDAPFKDRRKIDPLTIGDYPDPSSWTKPGDAVTGIAGIRNDDLTSLYTTEPHLPGVIYIRVMDNLPEFSFEIARSIGSIPAVVNPDDGEWEIVDPITVDDTNIDPIWGQRTVQVRNRVSTSRMTDIQIESDQEWLTFRTVRIGTNSKNPLPIPALTRRGFINYIDNGIVGDPAIRDPRGKENIPADGEVHLEIRCDPAKLVKNNPEDPEKHGIYIGYITFKSPFAGINPVKLKVTFIYFRTPVENYVNGTVPGIKLNMTNSDVTAPNGKGYEKKLIFGTGNRATEGVDLLFGERAYEFEMPDNEFDARWYPVNPDLEAEVPYGFGDLAANDEFARSNSRDIRDVSFTKKSHVFLCKFNPDGGYPIVLTWNVNDFYPGSQAFIHDTKNGELFPAINMREATNLGGGNYSFTIFDPKVTQFMIEYTLPTVVDYVNNQGQPIIKAGWNLLSMPVRPVNAFYKNFYVNAINIPYFFSQNQYQEPTDGVLKPGIGYFIKYDVTVDTKFPGTYIYDIDKTTAPFDAIRIYPGWNTIGAASVPVNISELAFSDYNGQIPDRSFTRQYGVWAYITDQGYEEVSELRPGLGYWIKSNNSGYLKLNVPAHLRNGFKLSAQESVKNIALNSAAVLRIADNSTKAGKVYLSNDVSLNASSFELPPAPLASMFDVRFNEDRYLSNENESIVRVQGAVYPLTISVDNANANYTIMDAVTGEVFGTITGSNSVVVPSTSFGALKVVRNEVALSGLNFSVNPNPVAGISTVNFSSTENESVSVKLYDALGNEVLTLVGDVLAAGNYTVSLDASTLANGNYILKLVQGNRIEVVKVNVVK